MFHLLTQLLGQVLYVFPQSVKEAIFLHSMTQTAPF
jgi:hypothetical protein